MTTANKFMLSAALLACSLSGAARAEDAMSVLAKAIQDGAASAELTGALADRWNGVTKSSQPITASARVIKRFKQPGCARLEVSMKQEGVLTRSGAYAPFQTTWEMNICADGTHPAEGVVPGSAQNFLLPKGGSK